MTHVVIRGNDTTRASLHTRRYPGLEKAARILICASAVVAGAGFTLLLIGLSLLLDLFEQPRCSNSKALHRFVVVRCLPHDLKMT